MSQDELWSIVREKFQHKTNEQKQLITQFEEDKING